MEDGLEGRRFRGDIKPFAKREAFATEVFTRCYATAVLLADDAGQRTRRTRVELLGNAAGEKRLAPGLDRVLHGLGHKHRVLRLGDRGIHEYAIGAEFHGHGCIRSCAHARVHDQRHFRDALT